VLGQGGADVLGLPSGIYSSALRKVIVFIQGYAGNFFS
jgi:hypothetical protein